MPDEELASLCAVIRDARTLLEVYGDRHTAPRLRRLEEELKAGDTKAVAPAISEATGSMGSLNDRFLCPENGDAIAPADVVPANAKLQRLVREVERRARLAAAAHGIALVR